MRSAVPAIGSAISRTQAPSRISARAPGAQPASPIVLVVVGEGTRIDQHLPPPYVDEDAEQVGMPVARVWRQAERTAIEHEAVVRRMRRAGQDRVSTRGKHRRGPR